MTRDDTMQTWAERWNERETGTERIRGDERDLVMRIAIAPVSWLRPDPSNKRLYSKSKEKYGGEPLTPEECFEELWKLSSVKELYNGILLAGGLTEALYVTHTGTVREGNERLTALNAIQEGLENGLFTEEGERDRLMELLDNIPVKVLPREISEKEMSLMLADWHLGGKDPWPAMNQAEHIYDMNHNKGITVSEISYRLRKSRTWIHQRIKAYTWTREHFERGNRWQETKEFSYFEELYKQKKKLAEKGFDVEGNPDDLYQFMDWVTEKQIPRALDVRKLSKVLEFEPTRDLLYEGNGKQAFIDLKFHDASETSPRFAAIKRMNNQLDKMTWQEYNMIHEQQVLREMIDFTIARLQNVLETVDKMNQFKGGSQ
jgi:hypothetical protein